MQKNKYSLLLQFSVYVILMLLTSCSKRTPIYTSSTQLDYNQRRTYTAPQYKYKVNAIGWATSLGGTASGAYLGYNSNLLQTNNQSENKIGDAVIGGVIGFGLTHLGNYLIAKKGKKVGMKYKNLNEDDWLKSKTKNEVVLSNSHFGLRSIKLNAENSFQVKNMNDAKDFKIAFPSSSKYHSILDRDNRNISKYDLPELIQMFPNYIGINNLKTRVLAETPYVEELFKMQDFYPNTGYDVEKKAATLIKSYSSFKTFYNRYPKSIYTNEIVGRIYRDLNHNEAGNLLELIPNIENKNDVARHYIMSSNGITQLLKSYDKYPSAISKTNLVEGAILKITNRSTAHTFYKRFKNSKYVKKLNNLSYPLYRNSIYVGYVDSYGKAKGDGYLFDLNDTDYFVNGTWDNDKANGYFSIKNRNWKFKGLFKNGLRNGKGHEITPHYDYDGNWVDGKKTGYGVELSDGEKRKGEFLNGLLHGNGIRYLDDGSYIRGTFYEGLANGICKAVSGSSSLKGSWRRGVPVGKHEEKRWLISEALTTYEGVIEYDNNGSSISNTTDYDVWDSSSSSNYDNYEPNAQEPQKDACKYSLQATSETEKSGDEKSILYKIFCNGSWFNDGFLYQTKKYHNFPGKAGFYLYNGLGGDRYLGETEKEAIQNICNCN